MTVRHSCCTRRFGQVAFPAAWPRPRLRSDQRGHRSARVSVAACRTAALGSDVVDELGTDDRFQDDGMVLSRQSRTLGDSWIDPACVVLQFWHGQGDPEKRAEILRIMGAHGARILGSSDR